MLMDLHIKNIALVDELNLSFSPGLNVLTGETGAGKSVLVGAIMLILGERAGTKSIRDGAASALVEGSFDCSNISSVRKALDQRGITLDDEGTLIIRREISHEGRSRCYINGHLTTLSFVKEIGDTLVDVHSQSDHQTLLRKTSHLDFLDSYAGLRPERQEAAEMYEQLKKLEQEIEELSRDQQEKERMREMYAFYINEIDAAGLRSGEEEELRNRKRVLANAEKLHDLLASIYSRLEGNEDSAAARTHSATMDLSEAAKIDERLADSLKPLYEALISIEEVARAARDARDTTSCDADELDAIEERLQQIFSLKRKYGNTIDEILKYRDDVDEKLRKITHRDEEAQRLQKEIRTITKKLDGLCSSLSEKRRKHSAALSRAVEKDLKQLGMKKGRFSVRIQKHELTSSGADDVEFLISPNAGEKLKPLREIASTGEISRVMLAIKSTLGRNDSTPVLIFDEIDVNIDGNTAVTVGEKLSALGNRHQVICITHLPQVARFANVHFRVRKDIKHRRTLTYVDRLDQNERVEELARMLGASPGEKTSAKLARTMIKESKGNR